MPVVTTNDVPAIKILEMFGLKEVNLKHCCEVTITFEPDSIVMIKTVQHAVVEDMDKLESTIKKYKLVLVEEPSVELSAETESSEEA
jgi:hypothetical protein